MEFNTITISDGITMGTEGMKASLVSREVIADSVELVARGNLFDGLVAIAGCDKNMPGTVMALARLDIPSLMLYGGSIKPGHLNGKDITIQDVFEAIGSHAAGRIDDAGLEAVEAAACPGAGACGGQFTANTMAMACEFLGISPMSISGVPAFLPEKLEASREAGRLVMQLAKSDLRPSKIITPVAIENAIASVAASGGSTNAVLHFLAIAHEMNIPLTMDDFDRISSKTPLLCDLKPGGNYVAADYHAAGGSRLLARRLVEAGLIDGSALNVSGKTLAEEAAQAKETPGQVVIHALNDAIKSTGGLVILKGNLAPEGCVIKVAGHKRLEHSGPARVFDTEQGAFHAVESGQIKPNDVVVIRYEGPKGGPGMREMLQVTAAVAGIPELSDTVALLTDGPLLRSHARPHGRPRSPRSRRRRAHRRHPGRRHHPLRHPQSQAVRRTFRPRTLRTSRILDQTRAKIRTRGLPQIHQHRLLSITRSRNALTLGFLSSATKEAHHG